MTDILWEQSGSIARIILNRPDRKNAIGGTMRRDLAACFDRANEDSSVRAVLLEARGDCFCAGADVQAMGNLSAFDDRKRLQMHSHRMIKSLYALEKPVTAVVRGPAVGMGLSMVLACDFVVASDNAKFSCVFSRRGLAPDTGSAFLLSRLISPMKARDLIYTGRSFSAEEAKELDLVTEVVDDNDLEVRAQERADMLAQLPTLSVAMSKKMLQLSLSPSLDTFLDYEALIQPLMRTTEDYREGVASFREKRPAVFQGR